MSQSFHAIIATRTFTVQFNTSTPTAIGFWQSFVAMVMVLVKLHSKKVLVDSHIYLRGTWQVHCLKWETETCVADQNFLHEQKHVVMRTNMKSENADWIILLFQMDMKSVGTFYYESFVSVIFIYGTSFCSCNWMKVNFDLALNCLPTHYNFTQTAIVSCPLFIQKSLPERVQSNLTTFVHKLWH